MNQEAAAPPEAKTTPIRTPTIHVAASGLSALQMYEKEIAVYLRELPTLLEEGHSGKHVLVKENEILAVFDTQNDAIQAGRLLFGINPIFVKNIDGRDTERFALMFAQMQANQPCQP